jgi:hypothetical protein
MIRCGWTNLGTLVLRSDRFIARFVSVRRLRRRSIGSHGHLSDHSYVRCSESLQAQRAPKTRVSALLDTNCVGVVTHWSRLLMDGGISIAARGEGMKSVRVAYADCTYVLTSL